MADLGLRARWCGAGIVEFATADDRQIAYVDGWLWSNTGWEAFGVPKPAEYASRAGFVEYVRARQPEAVLVLLTHDHVDHIGDYFEMLAGLQEAGVNVRTVAQSDMARVGLVQRYRDAGLDPSLIVLNGGAGANIGGWSAHGDMQVWVVPAVHSTFLGFPAVGFVLEMGGVRVYASGDTDVFGDMTLIGRRYRPDAALVCVGNSAFTMGPEGAALALELLGCAQAIPIHYAHNPRALGPEAGPLFARLIEQNLPDVRVHTPRPGDTVDLRPRAGRPTG
jgi:L-ascorbate metabolism protein UlaG (beta-lactamase superfamily)